MHKDKHTRHCEMNVVDYPSTCCVEVANGITHDLAVSAVVSEETYLSN